VGDRVVNELKDQSRVNGTLLRPTLKPPSSDGLRKRRTAHSPERERVHPDLSRPLEREVTRPLDPRVALVRSDILCGGRIRGA
jgi:hypothetical protein